MTAELIRTCATRMREDATVLTLADGGQLTGANAGVVGWLRLCATSFDNVAGSYEKARGFATGYLEHETLGWVTGFRDRVAATASLDDLGVLAAEARTAAADRHLPGVAAADLSEVLRRRASELAEAGQAADRLDRKRNRMFALLSEAGASDPAVYRPYMAETVGRPVESSKSLTEAETDRVIVRLVEAQRQAEPEPASP